MPGRFTLDPRSLLQGARILPPRLLQNLPGAISQDPRGRPPGAPPLASEGPRLPEIPVEPYSPAAGPSPGAVPLAVNALAGDDYEAIFLTVVPPVGGGANGIPEITLYTTKRFWRGCDVYISVPFALTVTQRFSVYVYAIVGGARSLIATGRYGHVAENAGSSVNPPRWIASAHAFAEKFEIAIDSNFDTASIPIGVAIVASNDETEADDDVGAIPIALAASGLAGVETTVQRGAALGRSQLVGFEATQLIAGPRFLQFHDTGATAVGAGAVPILSFGMPAGIGQTVMSFDPARICRSKRFSSGPRVVVSTTGDVATFGANGDVAYQFWVR